MNDLKLSFPESRNDPTETFIFRHPGLSTELESVLSHRDTELGRRPRGSEIDALHALIHKAKDQQHQRPGLNYVLYKAQKILQKIESIVFRSINKQTAFVFQDPRLSKELREALIGTRALPEQINSDDVLVLQRLIQEGRELQHSYKNLNPALYRAAKLLEKQQNSRSNETSTTTTTSTPLNPAKVVKSAAQIKEANLNKLIAFCKNLVTTLYTFGKPLTQEEQIPTTDLGYDNIMPVVDFSDDLKIPFCTQILPNAVKDLFASNVEQSLTRTQIEARLRSFAIACSKTGATIISNFNSKIDLDAQTYDPELLTIAATEAKTKRKNDWQFLFDRAPCEELSRYIDFIVDQYTKRWEVFLSKPKNYLGAKAIEHNRQLRVNGTIPGNLQPRLPNRAECLGANNEPPPVERNYILPRGATKLV